MGGGGAAPKCPPRPSPPHHGHLQVLLQRGQAPNLLATSDGCWYHLFNKSPSYLLPRHINSRILKPCSSFQKTAVPSVSPASSQSPGFPRPPTRSHGFSNSVVPKSLRLLLRPSSSLIGTRTAQSAGKTCLRL